jgi:hypothetical protein
MLQCNMNAQAAPSPRLQSDLEDILGSLQFARRNEDLGRLALLTYWEVRRWARIARREPLAERAARAITERPYTSRVEFLGVIDGVIAELESIQRELH